MRRIVSRLGIIIEHERSYCGAVRTWFRWKVLRHWMVWWCLHRKQSLTVAWVELVGFSKPRLIRNGYETVVTARQPGVRTISGTVTKTAAPRKKKVVKKRSRRRSY